MPGRSTRDSVPSAGWPLSYSFLKEHSTLTDTQLKHLWDANPSNYRSTGLRFNPYDPALYQDLHCTFVLRSTNMAGESNEIEFKPPCQSILWVQKCMISASSIPDAIYPY
jgi:hypothetical protein